MAGKSQESGTKKGRRHSVHKREGPRGTSWYAIVDVGDDPKTGKRKQKRVSAPTLKELDEKIAAAKLAGFSEPEPKPSVASVAMLMQRWLDAITKTHKGGTVREYESVNRNWINPRIGTVLLKELSIDDVEALTDAVTDAGRSATTSQKVHGVLRSALTKAVEWELVDRNICSVVKAPRRDTPEMKYWDAEQTNKALSAGAGTELECLWRLAITTGMRRGELLGLRWRDIDFVRRQLAVRHTLIRGNKGRWESGTPKTKRGGRTIALSDQMIAVLKRQRTIQAEARLRSGGTWSNERGLVFTGDRGQPISAHKMQYQFELLIAAAGVDRIRIHDLRHTAATLMLINGVHYKIVCERLGHSSVKMTLDLYSHVTETMQRDAADGLERLLESAS